MTPKAVLASALSFGLSAGVAFAESWPHRPLGFATIPETAPVVPVHPCRASRYPCVRYPAYRVVREARPAPEPRFSTLAEASALLDAGAVPAARTALVELTLRSPQDPVVWTLLGRSERRLGHLDAARESLRRAFALDPGHPAALAETGLLHLAEGQPAQALDTLAALAHGCEDCAEAITLRSALTGAGYHAGGTGPKRIRVHP